MDFKKDYSVVILRYFLLYYCNLLTALHSPRFFENNLYLLLNFYYYFENQESYPDTSESHFFETRYSLLIAHCLIFEFVLKIFCQIFIMALLVYLFYQYFYYFLLSRISCLSLYFLKVQYFLNHLNHYLFRYFILFNLILLNIIVFIPCFKSH